MGLVSHWATSIASWLVAGFVCYHTYYALLLSKKRRALKRKHGVEEAVCMPQNPFLRGLDMAKRSLEALEEHRFLAYLDGYFQRSNRKTLQFYNAGRHMYLTIDPENLRVIQSTEHKKWRFNRRRTAGFSLLLGKGIFTADGQDWKYSHDVLRPTFERLQIINLDPSEAHVLNLLSRIPRDGSAVDLSELFFSFSMDISTELLLGKSTRTQCSTRGQQFSAAFNRSQSNACKLAHLGWWFYVLKPFAAREVRNDVKVVHGFVDGYVDRAMAVAADSCKQKRGGPVAEGSNDQGDRYVFLDELVRRIHDPVRIRSELLNVLLAGRDTTASLLTNLWFTLSKRPDCWSKLQAEIAVLGGKKPTYLELRAMSYLQGLINESLRLYPVVPYNTREAVEDTILPLGGGPEGRSPIFVKKGELVAWSLFSMHRRKDFYGEEADSFIPERWSQENCDSLGWGFLPFHKGPRTCMGQAYAKTQVAYVTVRLCQEFDTLASASDSDWEEHLSLTMVNLHGAKVYLSPRCGE